MSNAPTTEKATATSATRRQPKRSATRPASGPTAPNSQSRKIRLEAVLPSENGGRCSRYSAYEKMPTKLKKRPQPSAVAASSVRLRETSASVTRSAGRPVGGFSSSGSERCITTAAISGSTAMTPSAPRQPMAAVSSETPTRPIRPPTTSAPTYQPITRAPWRCPNVAIT